jgi:hypothetical protein
MLTFVCRSFDFTLHQSPQGTHRDDVGGIVGDPNCSVQGVVFKDAMDKIPLGFAVGDVPGLGFAQFDAILAYL